MSEFHAHPGNFEQTYSEPQRTSGMAIAALVCSLIICCPLITILGPILGAISLGNIGPAPMKKGKGIAIAAIVIGTITTAISSIGVWAAWQWGYGYYQFVMEGPHSALQAGASGDLDGFRTAFHGAGATASDEEVQAFLQEMEARYGDFVAARFDEQGGGPPAGGAGTPEVVFPYILQFRNETIDADAELIFADQRTGQQMKKIGYILIRDPDRGDLRFPPQP